MDYFIFVVFFIRVVYYIKDADALIENLCIVACL